MLNLKSLINKSNYKYRLMQLFILVAHLVLLKWILYALNEGGLMPFKTIMMHFVGIATFGALLIRFCAWYFNRIYQNELNLHGKK